MLFFKKKDKQKKLNNTNYSVRHPVPKKLEKVFEFTAVGTSNYTKDIATLGKPSSMYKASKEKLQHANKQRYYEYYFGDLFYSMMPEPTNPYDNQAIVVLANGVKIGYVPAIFTDIVRAYMKHKNVKVSGGLRGGNYIIQNFGEWHRENAPFYCDITITLP